MCIIAYKPAGKTISRKTLELCFKNNPDGAGFMYPCEGKVLINKGHFTFDNFWAAAEKISRIYGDSIPVVYHFRIATAGYVDKTNCHPHRIAPDLAFVHNGILQCVNVSKNSDKSDTIAYRNKHLRKMTGKSLHNLPAFIAMGEHIGKFNKFVFMNGKGRIAFANESSGVWDESTGCWFSNNTYKSLSYSAWFNNYDLYDDTAYCEACGLELPDDDEKAAGLCRDCLAYEGNYAFCGGCDRLLVDPAHELLGWCDVCGEEIYGGTWPEHVRDARETADKKSMEEEHA